MRVLVIGGGVLGASAAFHLALSGADVVLADDVQEGRATAAGAGIVCPWLSSRDDPHWIRIAEAGARYYPTLIEHLDESGAGEIGYARVGALAVSTDRAGLDATAAALSARRRAIPEIGEVDRLSPAAARHLFPPLHPDLAALRVVGGARVDGRKLAAALRRGAEARGAQVIAGAAELLPTGARVGAERIDADRIVVAAGAWAPTLLAPLGIDLPVEPQRGQITHLRLDGVDTAAWPVILPPSSHYLLAFGGGRIVVGATREAGAGFDTRVTAAGQAEVLNEALAVAPGLASATLVETRVGMRPAGPDLRPLLGRVNGRSDLVVGNGLGPSGLTIGPYAGRLLAQLVLDQATDLDLAPYDPLRKSIAGHTP